MVSFPARTKDLLFASGFAEPPNQWAKGTLSHGVVLHPSEMTHICFV